MFMYPAESQRHIFMCYILYKCNTLINFLPINSKKSAESQRPPGSHVPLKCVTVPKKKNGILQLKKMFILFCMYMHTQK